MARTKTITDDIKLDRSALQQQRLALQQNFNDAQKELERLDQESVRIKTNLVVMHARYNLLGEILDNKF